MKFDLPVPVLTQDQISHLSRDYSVYPIKKGEVVLEKDLKYLYLNVTKIPEVRQKIHDTCKRLGSYKKSKGEIYIENKLKEKFSVIKCQYDEDPRYPYQCDFYIPQLDLFIEYQGYQAHGGEPYNPINKKHKCKLKEWQDKCNQIKPGCKKNTQYLGYINVWTISDPHKRKIAKDNGLNWIEFFNLREFDNWYNKLK